jgi:hypothetical protein
VRIKGKLIVCLCASLDRLGNCAPFDIKGRLGIFNRAFIYNLFSSIDSGPLKMCSSQSEFLESEAFESEFLKSDFLESNYLESELLKSKFLKSKFL